jgi:hypothetical protein
MWQVLLVTFLMVLLLELWTNAPILVPFLIWWLTVAPRLVFWWFYLTSTPSTCLVFAACLFWTSVATGSICTARRVSKFTIQLDLTSGCSHRTPQGCWFQQGQKYHCADLLRQLLLLWILLCWYIFFKLARAFQKLTSELRLNTHH